jgi:response regulator RpfG family c-di-GMP phosphodiesterase
MNQVKVLLIDDDPNVLQACQRILRKRFDLHTAIGAEEALMAIRSSESYGVIVCDMKMPGRNGVELMQEFIKQSPDSVRIMLTGNADQKTASDAINLGKVFRFLTKPCPSELLAETITEAIEHYRRSVAEKELLTQTVQGAVRMLTEVLSVANPVAFGRASRLHQLMASMVKYVTIEHPWECEMAAMLSQVGCISIPADTLDRAHQGKPLTPQEMRLMTGRYKMAYDFIRQVPRLENVARIVENQDDCYLTQDPHGGMPLAAHMLRVARDFDSLVQVHRERNVAMAKLRQHAFNYDPVALGALQRAIDNYQEYETRMLPVSQLEEGWLLANDVRTSEGTLLVKEGQMVTTALIARLTNHARTSSLVEPLEVLVPVELALPTLPEFAHV